MNVRYRGDMGAQARAFAALFRGDLSKEQATQPFWPSPSMARIITYDIVEGPVDMERFIKFLQEQVVRFTDNFLLVSLIDKLENRCRLLTLILALAVCS